MYKNKHKWKISYIDLNCTFLCNFFHFVTLSDFLNFYENNAAMQKVLQVKDTLSFSKIELLITRIEI